MTRNVTMRATVVLLAVLIMLSLSTPALAATKVESEGLSQSVTFADGKNAMTANGVSLTATKIWYAKTDKVVYCTFLISPYNSFQQSGILKVWVERNGTTISNVGTYVTHGGGTRGGYNQLRITDDSNLTNLELKTSFTPGNDHKIFNPLGKLPDGTVTNIATSINGYNFIVDVSGGLHVGHLVDNEGSYWLVAGMKVNPEVSMSKVTDLWPEFDKTTKAGTYTITLSSAKANYSYTTTVKVEANSTKNKTISMDDPENPFLMPAFTVDDLKLSVSFSESK